MTIESVLMMIGGVGMFLYGMKLMGNSLERAAGAKAAKILGKLTSNKVKGVALGAGVTAVIQSSAATIIMVVGFLNAGILKLIQGVPVIMGANIGTTMTAQILRMGDIDGDNIIMTLLKPSSFAPVLIGVSAFIILFTKKEALKEKMGISMGLGILFMGMTLMQTSFEPLAESENFRQIFTLFTNPLLGVAVGLAVTIILQCSSASIGVLQATASTGVLTFAMAAPMVIGCNLGKCITVLLASIDVNRNARRAVAIDVMICVFGSAIVLIGLYIYQGIVGFNFWNKTVDMGDIANFHTLFNMIVAFISLPFINLLIALSDKIVREKEGSAETNRLSILDPRFIETPNIALEQCKTVIEMMCDTNIKMFGHACALAENYNDTDRQALDENEKFLDKTETAVGDYIVDITEKTTSPKQNVFAAELLHTVSDMERIGDHIVNLADEAKDMDKDRIAEDEDTQKTLITLKTATEEILSLTKTAYEDEDAKSTMRVLALEDTIETFIVDLKKEYAANLRKGNYTMDIGVTFIKILTDIERISNHCGVACKHLTQRLKGERLNAHEDEQISEAYIFLFEEYSSEYRNKYLA